MAQRYLEYYTWDDHPDRHEREIAERREHIFALSKELCDQAGCSPQYYARLFRHVVRERIRKLENGLTTKLDNWAREFRHTAEEKEDSKRATKKLFPYDAISFWYRRWSSSESNTNCTNCTWRDSWETFFGPDEVEGLRSFMWVAFMGIPSAPNNHTLHYHHILPDEYTYTYQHFRDRLENWEEHMKYKRFGVIYVDVEKRKFLLVKSKPYLNKHGTRKPGKFQFPKGKRDHFNESDEEVAKREFEEESGVRLSIDRFTRVITVSAFNDTCKLFIIEKSSRDPSPNGTPTVDDTSSSSRQRGHTSGRRSRGRSRNRSRSRSRNRSRSRSRDRSTYSYSSSGSSRRARSPRRHYHYHLGPENVFACQQKTSQISFAILKSSKSSIIEQTATTLRHQFSRLSASDMCINHRPTHNFSDISTKREKLFEMKSGSSIYDKTCAGRTERNRSCESARPLPECSASGRGRPTNSECKWMNYNRTIDDQDPTREMQGAVWADFKQFYREQTNENSSFRVWYFSQNEPNRIIPESLDRDSTNQLFQRVLVNTGWIHYYERLFNPIKRVRTRTVNALKRVFSISD